MKNNIGRFLFSLLFSGVLITGCKKDERDINLNLSEVTNLFAPADDYYIKLQPAANLTETFEWEEAKAEDGSLVLYEVVFDQETGDFSQPFYKLVSDNRGVQNKLTITHGDLNKVAQLGGAEFFERKKFKWTVYASKGTNVKKATVTATIELERPGGFDVLPGSVYITGTATEGGTNIADALKMRQIAPGVFELFSKLKSGTYKFVDALTGTPKVYYLFDDNGINAIGMDGESTFSGADKIMRIRLDFNNINGSFAEVKEVALWYCQGNTFWFTLPYTSNGVWRKNGHTVTLGTVPWGLEERYKYRMVIDEGNGNTDLWLNYATNDSPGQDGQWPHTLDYKTINLTTNNGSQWDWTWKFDKNYLAQGTVADFWISLRGSEPAYTQNYQKQ